MSGAPQTDDADLAQAVKELQMAEEKEQEQQKGTAIDSKFLARFPRLKDALDYGGRRAATPEEIAAQRAVIWEFIKKVGSSFMKQKDIINQSLPVKIFEPRSYLQRLTDQWVYLDSLHKAAATEDPVERIKHVLCFAIGGLHLMGKNDKPFNPILGETYEAKYDDGTEVYIEQTSHHPPMTSFQLLGPNGAFTYYGYHEWKASFQGNSVKGWTQGINVIDFADGGRVTFELPPMWVKGVLWGERVFDYAGDIIASDEENLLFGEVRCDPDAIGFLKSWFVSKKTPTDYLKGEIYEKDFKGKVNKVKKGPPKLSGSRRLLQNTLDKRHARRVGEFTKKSVCPIEGTWVGALEFEGKAYWDINAKKAFCKDVPEPLPSDCRFREDLQHLLKGDVDGAQHWKVVLEEKQRYDRKLRAQGRENP
eukprot:TRINITY_DN89_c0_g1_i8.p1 TRINITY_DN89_c0_g1~~TRINITY_DN89_c0_g1_i8.p1  ORF type:complete len:420 (-),score=75.48 TRINITY_DN89_c0_g1_i8:21-1280(-)